MTVQISVASTQTVTFTLSGALNICGPTSYTLNPALPFVSITQVNGVATMTVLTQNVADAGAYPAV